MMTATFRAGAETARPKRPARPAAELAYDPGEQVNPCVQELLRPENPDNAVSRCTCCSAAAAILDDAHLAKPLALAHMTEQDGGCLDLSQNLDLATDNPEYTVTCVAV
jgi:hypothetical protein